MSGAFVLCGDVLLRTPGARIPRESVAAVRDSVALLEEAKQRRDRAGAVAQEAREVACREARDEALAEMRAALAESIAKLHEGFIREDARRERETASAAMEVVEHLIGQRPDADVVTGLAAQALGRVSGTEAVVKVAPDLADAVAASLSGREGVQVVADASLPPLACRIDTGDGRVVADLSTQLATLRDRWGLEQEPAR